MARADLSATDWALWAGEGGSGVIGKSLGRTSGRSDKSGTCSSTLGLGNARSMADPAYASTVIEPMRACARVYLPRLNPAIGMGRSETQRVTCSPGCTFPAGLKLPAAGGSISWRLPVATSVQPTG